MDAAYRRTPESAIHPTPFSACSFVWDANHAAFSAVGPRFSVSFGPTFSSSFPHLPRGCFTCIYLCLYVCATFMLLSILGRLCRSRGGSLSFVLLSLSFCAPHVLLRLVPTILEYVRYARALACFVDRGHTGRIRERKEFF